MALLRHGEMGTLFAGTCAPSAVGSFLWSFAFGHVRQLDAVAWRWLVDIGDTFTEVRGYRKQGSGHG